MLVAEIAAFLDTEGMGVYDPTGITGNVFICTMPATPDTAIAVYPRPGLAADGKLKYDTPGVQIVARGTQDPTVGEQLATDIYNALHGFHDGVFVAGGVYIVNCLGLQSGPNHLGRDDNGRHEYSLNFQITVSNEDRRN